MSTVEQVIARIAGAQHGIVTRAELLAAGISGKEIRHRIEIGLLVRVYNGVYSVGHRPLTWQSVYMAAVKAGGPGAVLCELAAAYLLGILKAAVPPPPEVATGNQRRIPGLRARRLRLTLGDVTEYQGIPCTTVPCTIVHIAGLDEYDLARVCHEADIKFRGSVERVEAALERHPKAKGARKLRRIINGDSPVLLSIVEKGFFDVLRDGGWPATRDQRQGRRPPCRLPLAGHHHRAQLVSLPPVASQVGARLRR